MSSKLNNIQRLQNQIKSLKGQLKSRNLNNNSIRQVRAPVSQQTSWTSSSRPLRVRQSERIATITASANAGEFDVTRFDINPANSNSFPWLSGIAQLFDKYKFHELKFRFINYVSTVTNGNVSMAVDFDTLDQSPNSSVGMSNLAKFTTFSPWKVEELSIPVNRRGNRQWLFCYDSNAESNTIVDLKTYNLGSFFVSTEGLSSSQVVGYIVAEYDVEFLDKNPPSVTESVLDNDFAVGMIGGLNDFSEESGLSVSESADKTVITITNAVIGEQYNLYIKTTSANNVSLTNSGFTGVTGEFYQTPGSGTGLLLIGLVEASATTMTITSSGTLSSLNYCITKI